MTAPPAMETCKHSWGNYDEYPDGLVETSCHLCGFTRRGHFVDNTRDLADDEADGLRAKLRIAREALEDVRSELMDCDHADECGRTLHCEERTVDGCAWCGVDECPPCECSMSKLLYITKTALNQLSKSASNPQESHGT